MAKIIGNTTATPNPRPDWTQTDSAKADYIKNKPTLGTLASKDEIAKTDLTSEVQTSLNKADTAIQSIEGLATEIYVDNKISDLVNAAPEALNTLNELAEALGDDPNFATTVATQIGTKVDKVVGTVGNAVAFGANGAIVDSNKQIPSVHIVPFYSSDTITDAQKNEIIEAVNQINSDTGEFSVLINTGTALVPAQYTYTARQTDISTVSHGSTSLYYSIKVTSAGVVTTNREGFFVTDMVDSDSFSSAHAPTASAVCQYVEDQRTKVNTSTFDETNSIPASQKSTADWVKEYVAENSNGDSAEGAVLYTEQTLTEEQKTQARENIGAVSIEDVEEYLNGGENDFSVTGDVVELEVEADTPLEVISKIHRDETWGESNKLILHQVSGSNFVNLTSYFSDIGPVIEKDGLTATINDNCTATIVGTNESTGWTAIIGRSRWSGDDSARVYPAGTYTIPSGFTMAVRAAQYPSNVAITGMGNLTRTVTIPEPFRIVSLTYNVGAGQTVDVTVPLGIFRGSSIPETGFEYSGILHTVTFDAPVYEGEFNWNTGELKDVNGNLIAYYDSYDIKSMSGTNYFWTCFGENTVSNRKDEGKVLLRLNETAPVETVTSICDFMLTPVTPEAAYGLYYAPFLPNGEFCGNEVPVLTTKGTLSVKDIDGNVKYSKYIEPIFNSRGVADVLTHKGLEKKWSEKFYLNKEPVSTTINPPSYSGPPDAYVFVWEFEESEFVNTGIPAKIHDIPMASPCFINNDESENNVNTLTLWNGTPYPAFFSYNEETGKYTLTARGIQGTSIMHQLTTYNKVHFYYQLETPYTLPFAFAMGIDAGDQISFEADLTDNQPYIDNGQIYRGLSADEINVDPTIVAFVPRNVKDALHGMNNAARMLNMDDVAGGDATVQGYSWIGEGDGVTDYTIQIQSKLDELHNISNGGTIHLGSGTYPISKSLIVYGNTRIIGNGHTIIEQRTDNTHAVIWSGSDIVMRDLTIKLSGACTELTGCIFVNSNNSDAGKRDEKYPTNTYVWNCSVSNVYLVGTYSLTWSDGYQYLSEEALAYRGVGMLSHSLYFNFFDCDGLTCKHLYAGVYNYEGGGSNNYRLVVTESRFAVYGGSGNNIYDINGHAYYGNAPDGGKTIGTDYIFYGKKAEANKIFIGFYDTQYSKGMIYFDGKCQRNQYASAVELGTLATGTSTYWDSGYTSVMDYGRGNVSLQSIKERYFGIGSTLLGVSSQSYWNTQFNPSIHNALSGAGVWGTITSNKEWTSNGIDLSDVCRYPKETNKTGYGLAYVVCNSSPSEESPVEIIIDISDRPIRSYQSIWIQFDHRYIAENYTVSVDTTNDGVFNYTAATIEGNNEAVSYYFNLQDTPREIYRIKISITKALQISNFEYQDSAYNAYTIDYNPDGLVGIVNIGMPSNEAYGRAFLGECGGSLYGDVDMHNNTFKNLPAPVEDGDAVSKGYLEEELDSAVDAALTEAKESGEFDGNSGVYVGDGEMPEDCNVQVNPTGDFVTVPDVLQTTGNSTEDTMSQKAITEAIVNVSSRVSSLETSNSISIPSYVLNEAEDIAEKVLSTRNAKSFVFGGMSDLHTVGTEAGILHAGQGIDAINNITQLDLVAIFGDIILDRFTDTYKTGFKYVKKCLSNVSKSVPYIQMQGNHDELSTDTTEQAEQKYFAYIGANNIGTVTDFDNRFRNYGYRDFDSQRIRVIYLNSADVSAAEITDDCYITSMQFQWFINEALDFTSKSNPETWHFIVMCHHPLNWFGTSMSNLLTLLNAYKGGTSGSITADSTSIAYNFTSSTRPKFIAHFHGHLHNFRVEKLGSNNVLSITIPNACATRNNEYGTSSSYSDTIHEDYGDKDSNGNQRQYNKVSNTANDTAFNIIIVDTQNEIINAYCYGAGLHRSITFDGVVTETEKTVVDPDEPVIPDEPVEIVNILDTIGYTDGQRCRTSGVSLGDLAGATTFGWYDCSNLTPTDVIRIYLPNGVPETETSAYAAHCTSEDETTSISLAMYTQSNLNPFMSIFESCSYSNNIITLTNRRQADQSRTKFRLSAQANGADCIMTLNQKIIV